MMKVGIVQSLIGAGGGNDVVFFSLLKALKGHDVTVYTSSRPLVEVPAKIRTIIPFKLPLGGLYQNFMNTRLPDEVKDLDFVYVLTGHRVINNTRTKMIYYNQNNFAMVEGSAKYGSGFWKIYHMPYKKMMPHFLKRIQNSNIVFVGNSRYANEQLKKDTGIDTDLVIYPGVDTSRCFEMEKEPKVVSIARISPEKNLTQTVQIANLTGLECNICGSVSRIMSGYKHQLEGMARKNVTVHPNISRGEILEYLAQSKVYLASSKETFGIATVEAIASGCIPIVPDNTANRETVPYQDLRYDTIQQAVEKVRTASSGGYDHYIPLLQKHIKLFGIRHFQHKMTQLLGVHVAST